MNAKRERIVLVSIFTLLFLSHIAWAVDCPIPDTGQTKCYDDTQEIACPQPGEPFYGQDAQYICNPQSYTSLAGGIIVQDNVTGLIWEVKQNKDDTSDYTNPHDADNTYTWYNGSNGTPGDGTDTLDFIAALNSSKFGGYSDWRLPNIKELHSIVDHSAFDPSINTTFFPNTMADPYWSSTIDADTQDNAWVVFFAAGSMYSELKSYNWYVRAVRGGQCGSLDNFIDNGDGTVSDTDTGLMWELKTEDGGDRDKENVYNWEEALSYCEKLDLAGYNDWRLPNMNELQSIVDYSRHHPCIYPIFSAVSSNYFSSTTYVDDPNYVWNADFKNVGIVAGSRKPYNAYVRAVRGGQCGSFPTTTTSIGSITTTIAGSTTTTTVQPCPTEEIYGDHSAQTELLRYLRDNILSTTPEGQEIIRLYYEWSPAIVKAMEEDRAFKQKVEEVLDGILFLIKGEVE